MIALCIAMRLPKRQYKLPPSHVARLIDSHLLASQPYCTRLMARQALHAVPISKRLNSWGPQGIVFVIFFNTCAVLLTISQFLVLAPLLLLPFSWAREYYDEGNRMIKGTACGVLGKWLCKLCSVGNRKRCVRL